MKVIHLNKVHYLSIFGTTFNSENPFVEATEENILKFHKFINNGFLKVVDLKSKEKKEEVVLEDKKEDENEKVEKVEDGENLKNPFGEEIEKPKKTKTKKVKE